MPTSTVDLVITPVVNTTNGFPPAVIALTFTLLLRRPTPFSQGSTLATLALRIANIPLAAPLSPAPLTILISDARGYLPVTAQTTTEQDGVAWLRWTLAERASQGDVVVRWTVLPRRVGGRTRNGPALDFRGQGGGLLGAGWGVLVLPPTAGEENEKEGEGEEVCVTMRWDLSGAGDGVLSAASSLGEGHETVTLRGTRAQVYDGLLRNSFFAVGPQLGRYTSPDTSSPFSIYWLHWPLPFSPHELGARLAPLLSLMRSLFHPSSSSSSNKNSSKAVPSGYRIFLRHNPHPGSLTGTALHQSFLLGYDSSEYPSPRGFPLTLQQREDVLAHEMSHNFIAGLSSPSSSSSDDRPVEWYSEGLAEYFSATLRWRAGLLGEREVLREVNARLGHYYSSPCVGWSLDRARAEAWRDSCAQRAPYVRGFVFALVVASRLRTRARHGGGRSRIRSIEDVVVELMQRKNPTLDDFINLLVQAGLSDAPALVADMLAGNKILVPPRSALSFLSFHNSLDLRPVTMAKFELGFDETSLLGRGSSPTSTPGTATSTTAAEKDEEEEEEEEGEWPYRPITGLIPTSRAAIDAGLREGDMVRMLFGSAYNRAKEELEAELELEVIRDGGRPFSVRWLPRERGEGVRGWRLEVDEEHLEREELIREELQNVMLDMEHLESEELMREELQNVMLDMEHLESEELMREDLERAELESKEMAMERVVRLVKGREEIDMEQLLEREEMDIEEMEHLEREELMREELQNVALDMEHSEREELMREELWALGYRYR